MTHTHYDRLAAISTLSPEIVHLGVLLQRRDIALEVSSDQSLAPGLVSEILAQLDIIDVSSHISAHITGATENFIRTAQLGVFELHETLFKENDIALTYYVLLHGTVDMLNADNNVQQVLTAPCGFGNDKIAEETPGYRQHTVRAASAVVVCLLSDKDTFARFMTAGSACATRRKLAWISTSLLFRKWPGEKQLILAKALRTHPTVAMGRFLVQSGDLIKGVWFITSGKLKIGAKVQHRRGNTRTEKIIELAFISAGDVFGTCELLQEKERTQRFATVEQDAELLFLPAEQASSVLFSDPPMKLILEQLAHNRRLWDEHMIRQALAYDSVDVKVNESSMKISKYQLADVAGLTKGADAAGSRRRRGGVAACSGSLRPQKPEVLKPRRSSVSPRATVTDGDDTKSRTSADTPRSTINDGDELKSRASADTKGTQHDASASSFDAPIGEEFPANAASDAPVATEESPAHATVVLKPQEKSKAQLARAMQQLEMALDETTHNTTTQRRPSVVGRSGRRYTPPSLAVDLPNVSVDNDTNGVGESKNIENPPLRRVSHTEWLARCDKLGNNPPVLVVDDSKTTLSVLKWVFKKQGCQVDLATDGLQALELMQRQLYVLVVCDILMPHMDGVTAVKKLREWELAHRPADDTQPVLLLTKADEAPVHLKMSELPLVGMRHKSDNLKDFRLLVAACFSGQQDALKIKPVVHPAPSAHATSAPV